ncbi:A/G-specific adenine glycosylase [Lusitaniella coriacea]|uniref:A/G-specific adenine glycosylase n=1 Tax=Lusitaniella coriacea TaxID=1983105 RepID=UPI003CE719E3
MNQEIPQLQNLPKIRYFQRKLKAWATQNLRDFPWRRTTNPYSIFVAEFLLQKTDAATVAPIYEAFLACYPTLETLAAAPIGDVETLLQPLGLFFRAERLCQAAREILEKDGGKIPNTQKRLLELPGSGKYTARSILAHGFLRPAAVLDTNVARILERFFGIQGDRVKSRCKVLWSAADIVAPKRNVGRWNLTLLDFGALVCTARNLRCSDCPLRSQCCFPATIRRSRA